MLTLALIPFALIGLCMLAMLFVTLGWLPLIAIGFVALCMGYPLAGGAAIGVGMLWVWGIAGAAS